MTRTNEINMTKGKARTRKNVPHTTTPRRPRTREETPFTWFVACGMPAYATLAGVRFDRLFKDADAIAEAFTIGESKARKMFGPNARYGGPGWAGISYGHINCLGSPLEFPQGSEVAHSPIHNSLSESIEALQEKVDWANAGLMPFYLDLWEQLKKAFPDRDIGFGGFGHEGPITTAWELRGHDFFLDLCDDPELCKEFLRLVTDSIVDYIKFVRSVNGRPAFVETGAGMYDDISAMIHPKLWPDMVLPFHRQYYESQTSGWRHAHIEGLTSGHLAHLDALGLNTFDPSVSPQITPRDLRDRCHVPFLWRLNSMQVRDLSGDQVRKFVFEAVADGASGVFGHVARTMIDPESVSKVHTFMDAARQVEQLLAEGHPRSQLRDHL